MGKDNSGLMKEAMRAVRAKLPEAKAIYLVVDFGDGVLSAVMRDRVGALGEVPAKVLADFGVALSPSPPAAAGSNPSTAGGSNPSTESGSNTSAADAPAPDAAKEGQ